MTHAAGYAGQGALYAMRASMRRAGRRVSIGLWAGAGTRAICLNLRALRTLHAKHAHGRCWASGQYNDTTQATLPAVVIRGIAGARCGQNEPVSSVRRARTRTDTRHTDTSARTSTHKAGQTQGKPTRQAHKERHKARTQGKEQKRKPIAKHKRTMLECIPSCSVTVGTIQAKATRKPQSAHDIAKH